MANITFTGHLPHFTKRHTFTTTKKATKEKVAPRALRPWENIVTNVVSAGLVVAVLGIGGWFAFGLSSIKATADSLGIAIIMSENPLWVMSPDIVKARP